MFDTQLLISRFDLDDYIWAAINIYLGALGEGGKEREGWPARGGAAPAVCDGVLGCCGVARSCLRRVFVAHWTALLPTGAVPLSSLDADIINLFLYLLRLLGEQQRSN